MRISIFLHPWWHLLLVFILIVTKLLVWRFIVYFSDDRCRWECFHVLINHLWISSIEMSLFYPHFNYPHYLCFSCWVLIVSYMLSSSPWLLTLFEKLRMDLRASCMPGMHSTFRLFTQLIWVLCKVHDLWMLSSILRAVFSFSWYIHFLFDELKMYVLFLLLFVFLLS